MSATAAILKLDLRGVMRDNVMVLNVVLSFAVMVAITVLGLFKAQTSWAEWFPFMVIMSLLTGPPAYGFLFGLLMVDERDTGVRQVLSITPVPAVRMLLVRTIAVTLWMLIWPMFTVMVMNATWDALSIGYLELLAVVAALSVAGPLTALAVATYAVNKVEAMAMFKGINFIALASLALYFIPAEATYRHFFLILPTSWAVYGFDAFVAGENGAGYMWTAGCVIYLAVALAWTLRIFVRSLYKSI